MVETTPVFPAIYYNINVPARIVHKAEELSKPGRMGRTRPASQGLALTPAARTLAYAIR
jgi:hypothetical protein